MRKISFLLILISFLFIFGCTQAILDNSPDYVEPVYTTIRIVDENNETVFFDDVETTPGTNAFELMKEVFGSKLKYQEYAGIGVFIEEINDIAPSEDSFFKLYVDGQEAQRGISTYIIEEDTIIEWRIEKINNFDQ
jgi:hypothetical protein